MVTFSCVVHHDFSELAPIALLEEVNLAPDVQKFYVGPLMPWPHVLLRHKVIVTSEMIYTIVRA